MGPSQVVADALLVATRMVEPVSEMLVQIGARELGHRVVCDLAQEQMAEAEDLVLDGPKQLPPNEALEGFPERRPLVLGEELDQCGAAELSPNHRSALKRDPLARIQPLEPGGEECMDRGRDRGRRRRRRCPAR
jgi:hypothetical protein